MKVYHYDNDGYYTGSRDCQKDPMAPGKFLVPPRSTEIEPPAAGLPNNAEWQWKNNSWVAVTSRAYIKAKTAQDEQDKMKADMAAATAEAAKGK